MRKIPFAVCVVLVMLSLTQTALANPNSENRAVAEVTLPCSLILNPVGEISVNARGAALVYNIEREVGGERTSVSIVAHHLPAPSSLGDYDSYEGFAQIPGVISWRFRLYPTPEPDNPTWAGRFDDISADLTDPQAKIQVRLANSRTNALGPAVLENTMDNCCHRK